MILDKVGQPVRYIRQSDGDIEAAVARELRAEQEARSGGDTYDGSVLERVDASLAEYYAEHTRRVKAGEFDEPNPWAEASRARSAAPRDAKRVAAEIRVKARKSRPTVIGKWTRWP